MVPISFETDEDDDGVCCSIASTRESSVSMLLVV